MERIDEENKKHHYNYRLNKALRLAEKYEKKYNFEREVNKELGKRNELLKKDLSIEHERFSVVLSSYEELSDKFSDLISKQEILLNATRPISQESLQYKEILNYLTTQKDFLYCSKDNVAKVNNQKKKSKNPKKPSEVCLSLSDLSGSTNMSRKLFQEGGESINPARSRSKTYDTGGSLGLGLGQGGLYQSPRQTGTFFADLESVREEAVSTLEEVPGGDDVDVDDNKSEVFVTRVLSPVSRTATSTPPPALPLCDHEVPLFEHFLVVGMPAEAANGVAAAAILTKLKQAGAISSRSRMPFLSSMTGIFSMGFSTTKSSTNVLKPPITSKSIINAPSTPISTSTATTSTPLRSRLGFLLSPSPAPTATPTAAPVPAGVSMSDASSHVPPSPLGMSERGGLPTASGASASPSAAPTSSATLPTSPSDGGGGGGTISHHDLLQLFSTLEDLDYTTTADPSILFRYPPDIDPPPPEVCDFCLPDGARVNYIHNSGSDDALMDMLYGGSQSRRSHRSFIFMLEDHNLHQQNSAVSVTDSEDEMGTESGRLFGICVMQPRLVRTSTPMPSYSQIYSTSSSTATSTSTSSTTVTATPTAHTLSTAVTPNGLPPATLPSTVPSASATTTIVPATATATSSYDTPIMNMDVSLDRASTTAAAAAAAAATTATATTVSTAVDVLDVDLESTVCFAFISRFPFFAFFFQIIYDILSLERLTRMEISSKLEAATASSTASTASNSSTHGAASHGGGTIDRSGHAALVGRAAVLAKECAAYTYLNTPLLIEVLEKLRRVRAPRFGGLMSFSVSPSIGTINLTRDRPDADVSEHYILGGMVSCAVMGLLTLLRPLAWVAPLIPILPLKHAELVESPVPILAGIVLSEEEEWRLGNSGHGSATGNHRMNFMPNLLQKCRDEGGAAAAVLHVGQKNVFIAAEYSQILPALILPGAQILIGKMKEYLIRRGVSPTSAASATASATPSGGANLVPGMDFTRSWSLSRTLHVTGTSSSSSSSVPVPSASAAAAGGSSSSVDRGRGGGMSMSKKLTNDRLKAHYECTPRQQEDALVLKAMLSKHIQRIANHLIRYLRGRKFLRARSADLRDKKGFDDDEEDDDADDANSGGDQEHDRYPDRDELEDDDTDGFDAVEWESETVSDKVGRGMSLEDLTPSIVGSEGPSLGYEILGLTGASLEKGDERAFMKRFRATQMFVQYKESCDAAYNTMVSKEREKENNRTRERDNERDKDKDEPNHELTEVGSGIGIGRDKKSSVSEKLSPSPLSPIVTVAVTGAARRGVPRRQINRTMSHSTSMHADAAQASQQTGDNSDSISRSVSASYYDSSSNRTPPPTAQRTGTGTGKGKGLSAISELQSQSPSTSLSLSESGRLTLPLPPHLLSNNNRNFRRLSSPIPPNTISTVDKSKTQPSRRSTMFDVATSSTRARALASAASSFLTSQTAANDSSIGGGGSLKIGRQAKETSIAERRTGGSSLSPSLESSTQPVAQFVPFQNSPPPVPLPKPATSR